MPIVPAISTVNSANTANRANAEKFKTNETYIQSDYYPEKPPHNPLSEFEHLPVQVLQEIETAQSEARKGGMQLNSESDRKAWRDLNNGILPTEKLEKEFDERNGKYSQLFPLGNSGSVMILKREGKTESISIAIDNPNADLKIDNYGVSLKDSEGTHNIKEKIFEANIDLYLPSQKAAPDGVNVDMRALSRRFEDQSHSFIEVIEGKMRAELGKDHKGYEILTHGNPIHIVASAPEVSNASLSQGLRSINLNVAGMPIETKGMYTNSEITVEAREYTPNGIVQGKGILVGQNKLPDTDVVNAQLQALGDDIEAKAQTLIKQRELPAR